MVRLSVPEEGKRLVNATVKRGHRGREHLLHLLAQGGPQRFQCGVNTTAHRPLCRVEGAIHLMLQCLAHRLDNEISLLACDMRDLLIELSDHRLERTVDEWLQAGAGRYLALLQAAIVLYGRYARHTFQ